MKSTTRLLLPLVALVVLATPAWATNDDHPTTTHHVTTTPVRPTTTTARPTTTVAASTTIPPALEPLETK